MCASPNGQGAPAPVPGPLTIRELTSIDAFDAIRREWDALVRASGSATVNLTHAWLSEWWKCNRSQHRELLVLLAYADDSLIGAAPFMKTTRRVLGLPVRTLEFLTMAPVAASPSNCSGDLDCVLTVRHEEVLEAFFRHLRARHRWDCVRLCPLPESSATLKVLQREAAASGAVLYQREAFSNAVICMGQGWDAYLETLSKQFRRTLRQHEQKLQKLGAIRCVEYRTPFEIEVMYGDVLDIERDSWKWGKGVAINSTGYSGFYRRFALAAAELGWMRLWMIELDGRNIAYDYCIAYAHRVQSLKKSYRNEYRSYFPGGVLDLHAFAAMSREGAREIDLLWGDEEAKTKWAPIMRPHVEAVLFNATAYARFIQATFVRTRLSRLGSTTESLLKRVLRRLGLAPQWSELTREDQLRSGGGDPSAARAERLEPGMAVRVRERRGILKTLDGAGALGGIVFLPEMMRLCGGVYRVGRRDGVPWDGKRTSGPRLGGVVLRSARCDGKEHAGCDRACQFLWREEWLERVDAAAEDVPGAEDAAAEVGRCQSGTETAFGQPGFVGLPRLMRLARALDEEAARERASQA